MAFLEWLNISNTKIDNGFEYLPESLERFCCQNIPWEKVREWCSYELKTWRKNNLPLIRKIKENDKLLDVCSIVARKVFVHERGRKIFDILVFYLEEELIETRNIIYSEQRSQIEIPPKQ
ncbi:2843_t:CDS:2 [Cetraspora pellucida]|uniref:2843_t:CDS:1 n=1 Tax=Cetraspora pellucida TaxID=1433469 RepID=A0ACA9KFB2_9GLOM|nr:2843_t:CDS:2 [Cetraspora pellucida]